MTKHCPRCNQDLPVSNFSRNRSEKDGLQSWCKSCQRAYRMERYDSRSETVPEKKCSICGQVFPASEFYKDKTAPSGLRTSCKDCTKTHVKSKYDPSRQRHYRLTQNYGIGIEDYEEMFELQEGTCAICGLPKDGFLHVDHDHKTGEVRGLLCNSCNGGLGLLQDDPLLLEKAIHYLRNETVKVEVL